ncbi:hypothetical protein HNR31_002248 [Anoxybacillus caldiproteolyticus]|uniref:Uncharacterized protein n=1 Tax=Thermaerobacillus caldiproteolyticus TaxID=247480 RepID=A0A7V9Z7N2_9BACL|nr:hypothetical protein [Anoxybacillus caldiproteolyticus]
MNKKLDKNDIMDYMVKWENALDFVGDAIVLEACA